MTVTADALDLLAGDPPRTRQPGDFQRHPTTGAPYVNHPTTGKRVMYGRPSSFGSALDNPYNLVKWKERQLLIGAQILEQDANDWALEGDIFGLDPTDRNALDKLAARCHDAAGSHLAADQGTHIHLLCEMLDKEQSFGPWIYERGEALGIPTDLQYRIVGQWAMFRARLGLTALAVEQTVVNDRWRLAGTLDRLDVADRDHLTSFGILEAGQPFVGDIKTGGLTLGNDGQPNYWVKYPVQLAAYVDAVPYDTETDERVWWGPDNAHQPSAHIALIYHYDLARALAGEVVDWQAIPVNVDAGREGGDLCRLAADFAKRRDLFAMPAPSKTVEITADATEFVAAVEKIRALTVDVEAINKVAAPVIPATVTQQVADPEPIGLVPVPGPAADEWHDVTQYVDQESITVIKAAERDRLRARIAELIAEHPNAEKLLRANWPEGVPTLKHDGHTDDQLAQILAVVRRVEAEVGAGWHPDDGPPPHVNEPEFYTDEIEAACSTCGAQATHYYHDAGPLGAGTFYGCAAHAPADATAVARAVSVFSPGDRRLIDEGPRVNAHDVAALQTVYDKLTDDARALCAQIATEARVAGRSISVTVNPTLRNWKLADAVIAWAASGRSVDELWMAAGLLATHAQCCDADATLGGLISQFTIEQADRLYDAAQTAN